MGISHFSKNSKRQLLVVTVKGDAPNDLTQLLQVTKLGSWSVKCRLPLNQTMCSGVIGPFGEDISDEELTAALKESGHKDVSAARILKGRQQIRTSMFKIDFPSSTLPAYLYVGYQRFKVNPFVADPWQCYKCQNFGHNAASCKGSPRCVACSGAHSVKDCHHTGSPRCCNCGGPHTANYGGCPRMKQAKQVEKTRSCSKISYRDALKLVKASAPQNSIQQPAASASRTLNTSSTLANQHVKLRSKVTGPATCTVGTQTADVQIRPTLQNVPVNHFIELLSKLLSLCKPNDNTDFLSVATKLTRDTLHLEQSSGIQTELDSTQKSSHGPYHSLDEVPLLELPLSSADEGTTEALFQPSPVLGAHPRCRTEAMNGKNPGMESASINEAPFLKHPPVIAEEEMSEATIQPSPVIGAPPHCVTAAICGKSPGTDPWALREGSNRHPLESKIKSTPATKNARIMQSSKCPSKKK